MPFRKNNHIKWSMLELRGLLEDEDSRVHYQRVKKHFALYPIQLNNLKKTLRKILDAKLNFCDPELQGVVLAYGNPKLLDSLGFVDSDSYFIHMDMEADFYVFKPEIGCVLSGIVNKKAENHVGILVHKVFNASIPKPDESDIWYGDRIIVGQRVKFTVTRLDFKGKLLFIQGKLTSDKAWLESFCNEGRNRIQVKKLETLMVKEEETELVKDGEPYDTLAELPRKLSPPKFTPVNYYRFSLNFSDSHSRTQELDDLNRSNEKREINRENYGSTEIHREKGESSKKLSLSNFAPGNYYRFSLSDSDSHSPTPESNDVKRSNEKREIHRENYERREIHREKGESPRKLWSPKFTPGKYYRFNNLNLSDSHSPTPESNDVKRSNEKREIAHKGSSSDESTCLRKVASSGKKGSKESRKMEKRKEKTTSAATETDESDNLREGDIQEFSKVPKSTLRFEKSTKIVESPSKHEKSAKKKRKIADSESVTNGVNNTQQQNKDCKSVVNEVSSLEREKPEKNKRKRASSECVSENLDDTEQSGNIIRSVSNKELNEDAESKIDKKPKIVKSSSKCEKLEKKKRKKANSESLSKDSENIEQQGEMSRSVTNGDLDEDVKPWIENKSIIVESPLKRDESKKKRRKRANTESLSQDSENMEQQSEIGGSVTNEALGEDVKPWIENKPIIVESPLKRVKSETKRRKRANSQSLSQNSVSMEQQGEIGRSVTIGDLDEDVKPWIENKPIIVESPLKCDKSENERRRRVESASGSNNHEDTDLDESSTKKKRKNRTADSDNEAASEVDRKPDIIVERKKKKRGKTDEAVVEETITIEDQDDEVKAEAREEKKKLRKKITENNNIESATIQDDLPDIKPFEFIKPDPDMILPSPKSKKNRRKNIDEIETATNVTENNQEDTKNNGFFSDVRVKVEPDPSDCESFQTPSKKVKKKRKKRSTGDLLVNNDIETFGDVKIKKEEIVSDVEHVAGELSKKKKMRKNRDPDTFAVVKVKDEPNASDVEDTKNFKVKVKNEILYTFEC